MSANVLQYASSSTPRGRMSRQVIAGRIITRIALAFLTFDVTMKLAQVKEAIDG